MSGNAGRGGVRRDGSGRVAVKWPFPWRRPRDKHRHWRELTYRRHNSASRDALSGHHIARGAGNWIAEIGLGETNRCLCAIGCHGGRHRLHLDTDHQCKNDNPTQEICERRFAHGVNME